MKSNTVGLSGRKGQFIVVSETRRKITLAKLQTDGLPAIMQALGFKTQSKLADALSITPSQLSDGFNRRVPFPRHAAETLRRMLRVAGQDKLVEQVPT